MKTIRNTPDKTNNYSMAAYSSSNSTSSNLPIYLCSNSMTAVYITFSIMSMRTILILPLCITILYLGHQRWRQQRSFKTTSHSDIFTYHVAVVDLIWVFGCSLYICGEYADLQEIILPAICVSSILYYGEILFHILTCVERYVAVVHPITYMGLKNARGAKIRNISIGCVWLLSFACMGLTALYIPNIPFIPFLVILVFSLLIVSFCNLSVLWVLVRPGPGDRSGKTDRVDQSKQRAFHTITAILGVLSLWMVGLIVTTAVFQSSLLSYSVGCVMMSCIDLFNLPCSLMLPLLYLHRAGKLPCC